MIRKSDCKWLNLETFCDLLLPKNRVTQIFYFTARVDGRENDPDQPIRQQTYLRALGTLPRVNIQYGTFLSSVVRRPLVTPHPNNPKFPLRVGGNPALERNPDGTTRLVHVLKSEEKGSDVNLATFLLRDAYRRACQCAVIVSNDSDLLSPIEIAKDECGLLIGLAPPRKNGSIQLRALANFVVEPRLHHLSRAQFPYELKDAAGRFHKPAAW